MIILIITSLLAECALSRDYSVKIWSSKTLHLTPSRAAVIIYYCMLSEIVLGYTILFLTKKIITLNAQVISRQNTLLCDTIL